MHIFWLQADHQLPGRQGFSSSLWGASTGLNTQHGSRTIGWRPARRRRLWHTPNKGSQPFQLFPAWRPSPTPQPLSPPSVSFPSWEGSLAQWKPTGNSLLPSILNPHGLGSSWNLWGYWTEVSSHSPTGWALPYDELLPWLLICSPPHTPHL